MPRFARVVVPSCPHHVTQRGNARRDVFYSATDRQTYLHLLQEYSEHYQLRILGYCLMTNHVHLVVVPGHERSLASTFREVHGRYAQYRNAVEHSSGHVWQNRFYSCVFEEARLPDVMRYVELNPVRAGLTRSAGDYAWSSALMHLGVNDPRGFLDVSGWRERWSAEAWAEALRYEARESSAIRRATYSGRPLGSEQFVSRLEIQLQRRLAPGKPGRPKLRTQAASSGDGSQN